MEGLLLKKRKRKKKKKRERARLPGKEDGTRISRLVPARRGHLACTLRHRQENQTWRVGPLTPDPIHQPQPGPRSPETQTITVLFFSLAQLKMFKGQ
jgi:hypothetical protein